MKRFKDFTISKKLLTGFFSVALVMLLVGAVGIVGMLQISQKDTYLYELG